MIIGPPNHRKSDLEVDDDVVDLIDTINLSTVRTDYLHFFKRDKDGFGFMGLNSFKRRGLIFMKNNNKLGCLIIHGFGGGIYEIESLDNYLIRHGYITSCPKLKGHTGNGKDMKNADYNDWIDSAEEELIRLKEKTNNIAIMGFSMGGLIAMNLAFKYDIKAMVTINTPIYYWNIKRVCLNIYDDLRNKELSNCKRYINAKKSAPIISMINFLHLLNNTKIKLPKIDCPLLILQTKDDDTTRLKSSDYIYDNISSVDKRITLYENGGHQILSSKYKEKVLMDIEEFIGGIGEGLYN